MDFGLLPPEVNSARMYAGPGSGPMLAAAAAWDGLTADLESTAVSYQSAIFGLTSGPWLGPSSASMAAAAMPYVSWMRATTIQAAQAANQAKMAAAAYEAAFAMTVPPPVIAANRSLLISLVATNFLGQNTAAIAATEAHYMEMWAQDAVAMYGYAGQSAAASMLTPFAPAPNTTNPASLAGRAAAVAQTTGSSVGTGAQTIVSMGSQLLSAVPTALQGLAQPLQSTSGTSGILDALGFTSVQSFLSLGNLVVPYTASLATVNLGIGATHFAETAGAAGAAATGTVGSGAGTLMSTSPAGLGGSAMAAGMGKGGVIGGLSVPPGWAAAAPQIRAAARELPITSATDAPALLTCGSGNLFSEMALAGMAGRAIGGTVGRREHRTITTRHQSQSPQRENSGPITSIATELRELAELHDSGILVDEEFTELKRRLLNR